MQGQVRWLQSRRHSVHKRGGLAGWRLAVTWEDPRQNKHSFSLATAAGQTPLGRVVAGRQERRWWVWVWVWGWGRAGSG